LAIKCGIIWLALPVGWESDPYAAPFYKWIGVMKIGDTATGANQRTLPKYQYIVSD